MKYKLFLLINLLALSVYGQEKVETKLLPNKKYLIKKESKIITSIEPVLDSKQRDLIKTNPKVTNERTTLSNIKLTSNELNQNGDISSQFEFYFTTNSKQIINGETKYKKGPTLRDIKFKRNYDHNLKSIFELIEFPEHQLKIGDTFETITNEAINMEGIRKRFFIKRKTSFTVSNIENDIIFLNFKHNFYLDENSDVNGQLIIQNSNGSGEAEFNISNNFIKDFNSNFNLEYSFELKKPEEQITVNAHFYKTLKQTIKIE